jgi:hypothetical protein
MEETLLLTLCNWSLPGARRAEPPIWRVLPAPPWVIQGAANWAIGAAAAC